MYTYTYTYMDVYLYTYIQLGIINFMFIHVLLAVRRLIWWGIYDGFLHLY